MHNIPEIIEIATGKNRKETSWRNNEVSWHGLSKKLSKTHRTAETYAEYISSPKPRQDEIKDVGGFVGGFITGGRRKKGGILSRSLLTLDIDHCKKDDDPWLVFTMLYDYAACMYSTHKHTPDAARLRLVVPFNREVTPEEYVAVCRKIAGEVGIEMFDDTTFQPHRLMYWPSTAKDAYFFFEEQQGDALDVDGVLASYRDWKDSSQWPMSSRVNKVIEREAKKQGDPTEKNGLIGAFCQTYGIHELMETFLSDVYGPTDVDDRYSFINGSTAGGVIVYDDKWTYSHHETDPSGGKLCNAFDLFRIHKFGLRDEGSKEDTPSNRLASYKATVEHISKDKKVKRLLGENRLAEAREDFAQPYEEDDKGEKAKKRGPAPEKPEGPELLELLEDTTWLERMDVDGKGNYQPTTENFYLIIANDPSLKGAFRYNSFERRHEVAKNVPWRKVLAGGDFVMDSDDGSLRHYIEKVYKISSAPKISDALGEYFQKNTYHPVRRYLNGLDWDGEERLDELFIKYLGAEDIQYVRTATRKTLTAAVARIFEPGVKFDYVLTLIGSEGIKKSTILSKLGGQWFSDSFSTMVGKEAYEQIQGVWLVEMGELAGLKKAEVENVKLFISKQQDRYRPAYGKRVEEYPRQCIFIATTNEFDFLKSMTGNRRFWPVEVIGSNTCVFDDLKQEDVDQIWAEAKFRYENGEAMWMEDMEGEARLQQTKHTEVDERTGIIQNFLDRKLPKGWFDKAIYERRNYFSDEEEIRAEGKYDRMSVSVAEIWCELFGKALGEMSRYNTRDLNSMMRNMEGWSSKTSLKRDKIYGVQRAYDRVVEDGAKLV